MPRQNRVTPYGELIAVPDRGMFLGFRGGLHDKQRNLVRYSSGKAWAICALEFKGRRRPLWAPGRLTELFFLDEATGLSAGHRPCGECRYRDYKSFKQAWTDTHPGARVSATAIDDGLHADRLSASGIRRTFTAELANLPDGVMVKLEDQCWLVSGDQLLAWSPGGYRDRRPRHRATRVTVITPRATVAVLAAGYRPVVHPSALDAELGREAGE
jgi:hypothetical protein